MLTLHKLVSRGVQEAISIFEGGKKQSADAYSIGSTVQPVVECNIGKTLFLTATAIAGNSTKAWTVPSGKIWRIEVGKCQIVCDGTVADRTIWIQHTCRDDANLNPTILCGATAQASQTKTMYIDCTLMDGSVDAVYCANLYGVRFLGGDSITFSVQAGVAGDAMAIYLRVREFDVVDY